MADDRFRKTLTLDDGQVFVFRLPTAKDSRHIARAARELAGDGAATLLEGQLAYQTALLTQCCVEPQDVDFDTLWEYQVGWLAREVQAWIDSFRVVDAGDAPEPGDS